MGDAWGPRPFFAPPYDSEDGLSGVSADWIVRNAGLKNVKFTSHAPGCISAALNVGAQAVGDGRASTILVTRATGNMPGRYHQDPANEFGGGGQWTQPFGWGLMPQIAFGFESYCRKYGKTHEGMAPYVVNQHRNGMMNPEGFYYQHRPEPFTTEDYLAGRWLQWPLNIWDADLPIQTAVAYLFTTAERAKDMKQKPVYILNHVSQRGVTRSYVETLDETEAFSASIAKKCLEGSGLTVDQLDVYNPYDGYTLFSQYYLEAMHWHGVQKGEAHDFYAGDITVEGPHPFSSSGGNSGNGRTRWWNQTDCIQQLQERAGQRQVHIKNGRPETAIAGAFTPGTSDWMVYGTSPD
jgi:acetyl-CoA acetyltransferase